MPVGKTFKRVVVGMIAAAAVLLPSAAYANTTTECVPYNSVYAFCTVYSWDYELGAWVATDTYFKYTGTVISIDP